MTLATLVPSPPRQAAFPAWCVLALAVSLCWIPGDLPGQTDSTALYKKIEEKASKHRFTRWIYEGVFADPTPEQVDPVRSMEPAPPDPRVRFTGRPIRRIEVHTMEPFGYSVEDTVKRPVLYLQRWGNRLHRKTRPRVVQNMLLFKEGDAIDPLTITESERVLRASPVATEGRIIVTPAPGAGDSVDVLVLVHDQWSIDVPGSIDLNTADLALRERNLLGWGQELQQRITYDLDGTSTNWSGSHRVYDIRGSHASSTLFYSLTEEVDAVGAALDRPFYSPLVEWAGGLGLNTSWSRFSTTMEIPEGSSLAVRPVDLDLWLARSFSMGGGRDIASRSSHFILGARYAQRRYFQRPSPSIDTARANSIHSLLLVSGGLTVRHYYKDRYLFQFGVIEDVPEGLLVQLTAGVQKRELFVNRPYLGVEIARGRHYDRFGYISATAGYGGFFERGEVVDGTLVGRIDYFTGLAGLGRWRLRQFVRMRASFGVAKPVGSSIDLNGDQLYGFSSDELIGTHKAILDLETVLYAPYNLLGFKFAPVLLIGFGTIGHEGDPFLSGRIYNATALGLLIRNENLLMKTFQVSIGLYPYLPETGGAAVVLNPFSSFSTGARDFAFTRPDLIVFQ